RMESARATLSTATRRCTLLRRIRDLSMSASRAGNHLFFFSSRRRHTRSVSAFLLNRSSDLAHDNRPLLVMRSNLWASGYDVDGTDQTSLGQFSGRVQQTYKHSVPRFFVPEHGTMFTLALVRFPPTATKEIQYLNAKGALTYTDIAGDPVLYGNLP